LSGRRAVNRKKVEFLHYVALSLIQIFQEIGDVVRPVTHRMLAVRRKCWASSDMVGMRCLVYVLCPSSMCNTVMWMHGHEIKFGGAEERLTSIGLMEVGQLDLCAYCYRNL
jgi:hypothetical protein